VPSRLVFFFEVPLLVHDRDAGFLAERRIREHHAEPVAGVGGQAVFAGDDRARVGVDAVQVGEPLTTKTAMRNRSVAPTGQPRLPRCLLILANWKLHRPHQAAPRE
jgi:hypothetical protein